LEIAAVAFQLNSLSLDHVPAKGRAPLNGSRLLEAARISEPLSSLSLSALKR